jgi:CheY-like chemotaxis protein
MIGRIRQTQNVTTPTLSTPPRLVQTALLVDGDPDTRLLYKTILAPLAQVIVEAGDGAEALGKALCERPALIVSETRLARVDGFALCSMLRTSPGTERASIVVVTAVANPHVTARAINAGADAVLAKPCDIDEMIATVRRVCEAAQVRQEPAVQPATDAVQSPRRPMLSRVYERRFTTAPPQPPPRVFCPICATPLTYQNSHVGGVSAKYPEQWDYFSCAECGTYQYRHRTRKIALVPESSTDR